MNSAVDGNFSPSTRVTPKVFNIGADLGKSSTNGLVDSDIRIEKRDQK